MATCHRPWRARLLELVILPCLVAWSGYPFHAQGQNHCKVRYTYNASGDRIQRDWYCWDPDRSQDDGGGDAKSLERTLESASVQVTPNPSNTFVVVALPEAGVGGTVELLASTGAVLRTERPATTALTFDVSALGSGMYMVRLTTASGREVLITPFLVEH